MCGIVGFTHQNRSVDRELIRGATSCLIHRGPDQQGVFESNDISMGAVRLTIIDLISGEQPMRSDDGDVTLVYNGEVYNHSELRTELLGLGHTFSTNSDTEVVLHSFLQWDVDCFRRLRGMFGLAIWSESQKRLILARDRVGIKPLYFCRNGNDVHFSSELKGIMHHPDIQRTLSLDGLNCYLRVNYVPSPLTLIEGVEKLPPGHILTWQRGNTRISPFWHCKPSPAPRNGWKLEEAKEHLDELLVASVKEHLVADVPVGIWASGGLDSSTILHYAAQASSRPLKTFSITFNGRSFDEAAYINEVAEYYGTEHSEIDLSADSGLRQAIEDLVYYSDEPGADAGCLPVWFLAKMSAQQVTVALSGEGADELFGGYLTYLADRYAERARVVPAALRRAAIGALKYWPVSDEKISIEYKLKRFLKGSLLSPDEAHVFWNGTFSEEEKAKLLVGASSAPMAEILRTMPDIRGIERYLQFDQRYYMADDILYKADRMGMAHSLEVRPPFLDHRIVEFAASLPLDYKIHGSKLKFILKELMKGKLPSAILHRKKVGFDIPAHDWFRGVLKPLLMDTVTERAVRESGIFRWEAVESVINRHMERHDSFGYHLWGLLILFLWMKRWNISATSQVECGQPLVSIPAI